MSVMHHGWKAGRNRMRAAFFALAGASALGGAAAARAEPSAELRPASTRAGEVEGVFHDVTPERVRTTWRLPSVESSQLLAHRDYDGLEARARTLREERVRNDDGLWRLREYYQGVSSPKVESDATWTALIERLDEWRAAKPRSVTPRIAAAHAWAIYGWYGRGTEQDQRAAWALLRQRGQRSMAMLAEARDLKQRCPDYWAAMHVALTATGWERAEYDAMFEKAFAEEPTYYDYAMSKVFTHLPRWGGDPGEWEGVAADLAERVGGAEGDALYARLVAHVWRYDPGILPRGEVEWSRVKPTFAVLVDRYPDSRWFANLYALLAAQAEDAVTARPLFDRVKADPWLVVWGQQRWIDHTRDWLAATAPEPGPGG